VPSAREWDNLTKEWLNFSSNPKKWSYISNDLLLPAAGKVNNNDLGFGTFYQ
jgi:hypothetical protein